MESADACSCSHTDLTIVLHADYRLDIVTACDAHIGLHSMFGWAQVITRTDGRALGVIAHLYVDPRALAVVSLSLRAKGLGGGAAGNVPLAALCQVCPAERQRKVCCTQASLCCVQKKGGALPAACLQGRC